LVADAIVRTQTARCIAQSMLIREGETEMMQTMLPCIGARGLVLVGVSVWMSWEKG
jgi:hypothetical protein